MDTQNWINADGLYGHDQKFLNAPEELNELYVNDIHSNKSIFLEALDLELKDKNKVEEENHQDYYHTKSRPIGRRISHLARCVKIKFTNHITMSFT